MEPLRSRCLCVRVAAPSEQQVMEVLAFVCKKESLQLPQALAARLVQHSHRNLRRCVNCYRTHVQPSTQSHMHAQAGAALAPQPQDVGGQ